MTQIHRHEKPIFSFFQDVCSLLFYFKKYLHIASKYISIEASRIQKCIMDKRR